MPQTRMPVLSFALAFVIASATAGCVPQAPEDPDWRSQGVQALKDVGSAVDTTRLVIGLEQEERLVTRYAVVTLVHAEESADTSVRSFTALQPPAEDAHLDRQVGELLSAASDLVRTARIRLAAQGSAPAELVRELSAMARRLESATTALREGREL